MKTYTKTITETKPRLVIRYDDNAQSPRKTNSNIGYFITKDREYHSPDKHDYIERIMEQTAEEATSQEDHIARMLEACKEELDDKVLVIYPVCKYEHSGVVYSLGTQRGWDYSNNGFYFVMESMAKECGVNQEDFEKVIKQELKDYNQYANGAVYCYDLYDEEGEVEDSCSGVYNIDDVKSFLPKEWANEDMADYFVGD